MKKYKKPTVYALIFFLYSYSFTASALKNKKTEPEKKVVVGSKIFTENILLAEMISLLLENKYGFRVLRKFNMGGTKLVFDSLKNKQIDLYPEYTGTGYTMILNLSGEKKPKQIYSIVKNQFLKKFQLFWSEPLGFENKYTIAVRKIDSRFKKLHSISQLKGLETKLSLAVGHEFIERKDGFNNFIKNYRLNFKKEKVLTMNQALMYSALDNQEVDLIMAYSTDGRIQAFQLKTLKDDKSFFPAYEAAYLSRNGFVKNRPDIKKAFTDLEGMITKEEMTFLNNQVDQLGYDLSETARNFLIKKKVLENQSQDLQKKSLLNYYLSKKKYFFRIFKEHLLLVFISLFLALCFSIPIGIWAVYNRYVERVVFFTANTFQTIPSMALLGLLIPILGIGFKPAICALVLYSLLPLIRNTYEGIKDVDASYIEASAGIGLTSWQILKFVQIPLALPFILAGVRTTTVLLVGTATLAAFIGAGGFGDPIFRGIATLDTKLIFLGAVPACFLAVLLDKMWAIMEYLMISKGLKKEKNINHIAMG